MMKHDACIKFSDEQLEWLEANGVPVKDGVPMTRRHATTIGIKHYGERIPIAQFSDHEGAERTYITLLENRDMGVVFYFDEAGWKFDNV